MAQTNIAFAAAGLKKLHVQLSTSPPSTDDFDFVGDVPFAEKGAFGLGQENSAPSLGDRMSLWRDFYKGQKIDVSSDCCTLFLC